MNDNELINRFLDGETSPEEEDLIKLRMQNDSAFRDEFLDMQDMQNTVLRDANNIEVPEVVTQRLMNGLDFPSRRTGGVLLPFLLRYRIPATTMVGVLLIIGGFLAFNSGNKYVGERQQPERNNVAVAIGNVSSSFASGERNNIPVVSSRSADETSGKSSLASQDGDGNQALRNFAKDDDFASSSATSDVNNTFATTAEIPEKENPSTAELPVAINSARYLSPNYYSLNYRRYGGGLKPDFQMSKIHFPSSKFELSFGTVAGDYGRHLSTIAGENSDGNFMNNCHISAFYKFNGEHAAGIEISNEKFYQEFSYLSYGQEYKYRQEPDYTTFTLQYRYMPKALNVLDELHPYLQLGAGGNRGGGVAKAQAGLKLTITPSISANFAAEEGMMLFNTKKNDYFVSQKFRLLCEIAFNL